RERRGAAPGSADLPPRGHRPEADDAPAAVRDDLVVHVRAAAGVVGDDGHDLAYLRPVRAGAEIDVAVLLGQRVDRGVRVLDDEAVPATAALLDGIGGQRLRAGVENRAVARGTADDGGPHAQGATLERNRAVRDAGAVAVDVRPCAHLRDLL